MTDPFHPRTFSRYRVAKIPGWAVVLVALLAGALGVGLFLLSASILLVLTPFVVVGVLILQWRIRRALRQTGREGDATSIDVEYRIIDRRKER
jgi:membrane protein implicated in regulation of membrane protease activity